MCNKRDSKYNKLKVLFLNLLSVAFKIISFINLKFRSINKKKYDNVYIISVDNLSFGGTGKTPLVIKIGKELKERGIDFCLITRGYKSIFEKRGVKVKDIHSLAEIGDEAALFRHYFPNTNIYIGKNRYKSIELAIKEKNKIIILDDGFQTTGLLKDLKIMLLNPAHEYYYLRNFKFLIKEEDIIINLNREFGKKNRDYEYNFSIEGIYDQKGNKILVSEIKKGVIGFSALGDNNRFKQTLKYLKLDLINFYEYQDHFSYTKEILNDLDKIRIKNNSSYLICSEKDFIKIKELNIADIPLIYVKNSIELNLNLAEKIVRYAEKKGIIKT